MYVPGERVLTTSGLVAILKATDDIQQFSIEIMGALIYDELQESESVKRL